VTYFYGAFPPKRTNVYRSPTCTWKKAHSLKRESNLYMEKRSVCCSVASLFQKRPRPLRALQIKGVLGEETYIYKYVHTYVVCLFEERPRPFWFQKPLLGKEKCLLGKEKSLSEKEKSLSEKEPCALRAFWEKKPCRNRYLLEKEPCENRSHLGKRSL